MLYLHFYKHYLYMCVTVHTFLSVYLFHLAFVKNIENVYLGLIVYSLKSAVVVVVK